MVQKTSHPRLLIEAVEAVEKVGTKDDRPAGVCRGVCLFFTGFRRHVDSGNYRELQTELKRHGYWVKTIELPNHGRPIGDLHGVIDDFSEVPRIVRSSIILLRHDVFYHNEPVFLIGHSTGVLGIMHALINWPKLQHLICGVIAFSTPFKLEMNAPKFMRAISPILEWSLPLAKRVKCLRRLRVRRPVKRKRKADPFYFDKGLEYETMLEIHKASKSIFLRLQESDLKVNSLLVIHGKDDESALEAYAKKAYQNVETPDSTYRALNGVGHELNEAVVREMLGWLNKHTQNTRAESSSASK